MKLLVIAPHFAPDVAPTGEVITSIVDGLVDRGHSVHVITALPWYRGHRVEDGWGGKLVRTEATEWGAISRLHPFPTEKSNIPARALAFGGFTALVTLRSLAIRHRPDAVLAMSPPLPLGFPGALVGAVRRIPFVFNIQDVFPDVAVEIGAITNPTVIKVASLAERFLYRRADAVTVLSEDLRRNVADKLGPGGDGKVEVIPNFVDTQRVQPSSTDVAYRREFGLGDRTVVTYAGNVGLSQPVELLVEVARRMVERRDVVFVVNGGGSSLESVQRAAAGLDNVVFVPMQPRERLSEVLAAADIHTILLRHGLARSSVPSKMYSILAAGRPVVASVDPDTEVTRVLDQAGAGVSVAPGAVDELHQAIVGLVDDPARRATMGASGRSWVERWLSPAAVAEAYEELFERLITQHN
ncbi:MAG: glycosyltransferase family 4 protein [Candidatus Microthrix sp.]|nr:glycosyltransferase family 4 protein [Candidatus Microthrix sp.]